MPEQTSPDPEQNVVDPEPAATEGGSSILSRLYVVLFLGGVVLAECMIAYFCIPTRSETAAMAGVGTMVDPEVEAASWVEEEAEEDEEERAEVDLGEYSVSSFQPVSNTTLRIDFRLYGTIHADDKSDFDEAWEDSTHRVRDQVIVTVRSCELVDLTDAGLGLIKRRILEKTNRTLGQPLLKSIVFSDFSFIEQ